ncbi:MAG TPA: gamma-glutamyltransferase family protein [Acidimicrobiales bacterium]|nr:gamma-glutamyltransferase family protein [Acidimicrobiales bacterium]
MTIEPRFTTRPELRGTFGMVAASHWLAAQAGMGVLERGGNAFDAAAAAGFVLEVVEPHQNGPGGEAPMVLWSAAEDDVLVVDGQGPAPAAATSQHFADLALDLVPGTGLLAACVPAALGSWFFLLERFGTMTLRDVLGPAIGYARHGFPVLPVLAQVVADVERSWAASWPTTAELWCAGGLPRAGGRCRNEALAGTYERILTEAESAGAGREAQLEAARRAVYEGFVAEAIDAFAATPVRDELGVHAGVLRGDDLARWRATLEAPARLTYRDVEVVKTGPWGQGPVLLQQLGLLRGVDVAGLGAGSAELVHVVAECAKLAFADREAFYGDPRAVEVPLAELLSGSYCDGRLRLVGAEASWELRPGSPGGREPRLPAILERLAGSGSATGVAVTSGLVPGAGRRGDTCHVDVADRFGNMISATPSGGWLQSSPTLPGLGFCLGTRAQMFWLEQGLPASLAPGKRPRTTLSPGMVLRDGKPALAFGTPGGDQQDQWTLTFLLCHLDLGLGLQAAIDAANWHTTHMPSSFFPRDAHPGGLVAEPSLGEEVLAELRRRGHDVTVAPAWSLGRVTAVGVAPDGLLVAGADPRNGQAYAVGR